MEIHSVESFLTYYKRIRERTLRVAACIPPADIEWTYKPGKFTIGDLLRHLAALERYMFAENFAGRASTYPGHGRELADGFDAVLDYLNEMHAQTIAILRGLPDNRLTEKCLTPGGASIAVWKWMRAMVEHEIHHRAQIYTYLAMLGVDTPPLYGLTSEEVLERSR